MTRSCAYRWRRLPPLLLVLLAILLSLAERVHAQSRVALVIGNSAYAKVPSLPNPAHDAKDVGDALERLGFAVRLVTDADFDHMRRSLLEFGRASQGADMAVLYFAGHGVEIDGDNWLLPTDVELRSDADASTEAIGLPAAIQAVAAAKTLGLVILDACRNDPFKSRMKRTGPTRSVQILGLAPVEPASNVLVAYAARDGTVANDGTGRNSPYTAALLNHLETPGLEIDFLFRNVRDDVMAATENEQQPFVYGSLSSEEIYFKPPPAGEATADAAPPDAAEIAWSFLQATSDVLTLARFVERFPESARVADARMRIASLTTAVASSRDGGESAPLPATPVVFVDTAFERAEKAVARRFLRDAPAVDMAWSVVRDTRDHTLIRRFIDQFPGQKRQAEADARLAALGQRPITVRAPRQPLEVDEALLVQAAADPDVNQCFRRNDQTDDKCRRAFTRFPDISRFIEDIRFTVPFCQGMGSPSGCIPTVKAAWNFPSSRSAGGGKPEAGGSPAGVLTPGGGSSGGVHSGLHPGAPGAAPRLPRNTPSGKEWRGPKGIALRHHGGGASGPGAGLKGTDARIHGIKLHGVKPQGVRAPGVPGAAGRSPRVDAPAVRTPHVRVNTPHVRVRAPDVKVNVRVPKVDIRVR